jgi:class 3 adenylate cyclase/tetratricopeptide (TPR) repeat protein
VGRAGTVTVLFTDVVGSTELISALGDDAWHALLHEHLERLRVIVVRHSGEVIKTMGDGIMAAFGSAVSALDAAADVQAAVAHENRRRGAVAVGVRVGVSGGDATFEDGDWFGIPVVEAARLCALAAPGQALVSALAKATAGSRGGHVYEPVGELQLKGIADPVLAYALGPRSRSFRRIPLPGACEAANHGPFAGRAAEQGALRGLWKEAVSGQRRVVLLSGEPGVGKTRLAVDFACEAFESDGAVVLFGRCDEQIRAPYQPVAEAIEQFVVHAPEDLLRQHTDKWGGRLAGWAPALVSRVPDAAAVLAADPETDRLRLFDAANALLGDACGDAPMVLVLDDVHWADEPTLVYLRHLVRASASFPLLVIATYRDTELVRTHPLAETLADLRKEVGVERAALLGLDTDEVRSLLESFAGHPLDAGADAAARTLQAETEGNPFFVRQMIGHLIETEALVRHEDRWAFVRPVGELGLPEGVREVIGRRLSRLSPMVNELLAAAAVVGREFDVNVLAAITGHGDDDIVDALEEALAARLIGEVPARLGRYSFSHVLIRTTLYEEISTNRRVRLHRAVARSLEDVGVDVGEVAYHFYEAAPLGDAAAALQWVQRAAEDATARGGYELAVSWYERALEIEEMLDPADPARRAALVIALGRARNDAGAVLSARSDFVAAAALARQAGRPDLLARAAVHYGGRYPGLVDPSDPVGPALLAEADAALPPTDSTLRVAVLDAQVYWLGQSMDRDTKARPAEQALAMARRLGQPYGIFRALMTYQFALIGAPHPEDRLPVADEAIELAQSIGTPTLVIAALNTKAMHLLALGRLSEVIDLYADCARLDPISATDFMSQFDVAWAAIEGRMNDWEQHIPRLRTLGESASGRVAHLTSSTNTWLLAWLQGRAEFPALLRRHMAEFGDFRLGTPWETCLAVADGQLGRARHILNGPERESWRHAGAVAQLASAGFCAPLVAALGDHDQIVALYDDLIDSSGTWLLVHTNQYYGAADHHLGVLARALGRRDEAEERLRAALASYDGASERLYRAAALVELAELAAERDDMQRCLGLVVVAEPEAREMGLEPLLARCARLRVALGVRHGEQPPAPRNTL